jgi:hypothetical protein
MERTAAGTYDCSQGETARIDFLTVERDNVQIRARFNNGSFPVVNEDFIEFDVDATTTLRLEFTFINTGSVTNVVTVVTNMPGDEDRIKAKATGGHLTIKDLFFILG